MKIRNSLLSAALFVSLAAGAHAATASFVVDAEDNSTAFNSRDAAPLDTRLLFNIGDVLRITASGMWNGGGGCGDNGPEGAGCGINGATGINFYSLVGRIGDGDYFKIGDSYAGTANSRGDLFLAFLDDDSINNSGAVTALVQVAAVPEPHAYAMLLAGLGLMGCVARRRSGPALRQRRR